MKGDLRDVMEVRDDDEAGTYRLMYTTRIGTQVYILDYFQKKGKVESRNSESRSRPNPPPSQESS